MESIRNEGIRTVDRIPQSVECLIMSYPGVQQWRSQHYHEYMELLYVLEGSYELQVGSSLHRLEKHDLFVILPGEPHCTRRLEQTQSLLCIKFLPQILFSQRADDTMPEHLIRLVLEHYSAKRLFTTADLAATFLPAALQTITAEWQSHSFGCELAIRAELSRLILWLVRYWHKQAGEALTVPTDNAITALTRAREYVQEQYPTATLAGASQFCGISYGYLSHLFGSFMHMSFSDYVNQVRISHARQLLVSTRKTMTQIAMETGFSTSSYFTQIFRRSNGVTPSQFRQIAQKK